MDLEFAAIVLLLLFAVLAFIIGRKLGCIQANKIWETDLPNIRKDAINRSRANLGGKFSENLCMYFPDFPHSPTEMRWLGGSPTDYLVFKGMDVNTIDEIVFLEIKSGKSQLSPREQQIKHAVKNKKVRWEMYRVPEEITTVK